MQHFNACYLSSCILLHNGRFFEALLKLNGLMVGGAVGLPEPSRAQTIGIGGSFLQDEFVAGCRVKIHTAGSGCSTAGYLQITDYKMAPKGAPVNGANLGSMGFKLSTKPINKLIIIR
jgi:hypothetical protein